MDRVELSGPQRHGLFRRRDVTSQVEGQMELAGSLETTRAILDAVVDSIITIDEQFRVLDVSPGTDRIYGVSHDERRGTNSLNIVLPDDRDHVATELRRLFRGEDGSITSYRFRAHQRRRHNADDRDRGRLIRDEAGHEPRAVLVSRDVTEAVAAEAVLKRRRKRPNAPTRQERVHVAHEP